MKVNNRLKLVGIPLAASLLVYFGSYFAIEHLRHRKGPWEVRFTETNGTPAVIVSQHHLGLENVTILLEGESLSPDFTDRSLRMEEPSNLPYPVPHGRVIYEDLTFLPGTVTLDLYGHGIELLPRTLILNGREHPWKAEETIRLVPDEKIHPITPAEYKARIKALKKSPQP